MCLLCVSIRACAKSPNVTVCNPDKCAEKSEIFPGIPLPCPPLLQLSQRGRSGAFSTRCCGERGDANVLQFFFSSLAPSPLLRRTVPSAGFPPNSPASAFQAAARAHVLPRVAASHSAHPRPRAWASASAAAVGGAHAAPTFPPGLGKPRAGRVCVRARARIWWGNLLRWKQLSIAGREYSGAQQKPPKHLSFPKEKQTKKNRKEGKPAPLKPGFPIVSDPPGAERRRSLAAATARTRTWKDGFSPFGEEGGEGLAGESCTWSRNVHRGELWGK